MMSIGQSREQIVQLMQRSSSSRNMPRKRSDGSLRVSGYWIVTFFLNRLPSVIESPAKRSSSITRSSRLLTALMRSLFPGAPSQRELDDSGRDHVGERERQHPLP